MSLSLKSVLSSLSSHLISRPFVYVFPSISSIHAQVKVLMGHLLNVVQEHDAAVMSRAPTLATQSNTQSNHALSAVVTKIQSDPLLNLTLMTPAMTSTATNSTAIHNNHNNNHNPNHNHNDDVKGRNAIALFVPSPQDNPTPALALATGPTTTFFDSSTNTHIIRLRNFLTLAAAADATSARAAALL